MPSFGQVQLPDWSRTNALFNNDAIDAGHAIALIRQNDAAAGSQDLADRATLRGLAPGLASRDPNAIANSVVLPVGVPAVNSLSNFDAQAAATKLNILNFNNQQFTDGPPVGGAPGVPAAGDDAVINKMGGSESGNNPSVVNGQGYNGQYQFGVPRLQELKAYTPGPGDFGQDGKWTGKTTGTFNIPGYPEIKTQADFLGKGSVNPQRAAEAQRAVMHMQIDDLRHTIAATPGADKYDPVGLIGIGHLGGPTGMQRYVATNGQYDPADANGTHLSDYYRKFSGPGGPQALQQAAGHPQGPLPNWQPGTPGQPGRPVPVQTASAAGSAGMPQTANDASDSGPVPILLGQPGMAAPAAPAPTPASLPMAQADPAGAPAPQAAPAPVPAAAPQRATLPPGVVAFRQTPQGGYQMVPGSPGYALARMSDGSIRPAPLPGVETLSRVQMKNPDGSTTAYSTTGQPMVTSAPNNLEYKRDLAIADNKLVQPLAQQGTQLEATIQKTLEARDASKGLPTGAGFETRAQIANWLKTYAPEAAKTIVGNDGNLLPDPGKASMAMKLLAGQAEQNEQAMGGSGGLGITQIYLRNNPNAGMQGDAIQHMSNLAAVTAMASKDYIQGKLSHITAQQQSFQANPASPFKSAAEYDKDWFTQNNTHTYIAAIEAMNGKPWSEWAKGLSHAEVQRALGVVARIDPTSTVTGNDGNPLPVVRFKPTNPANPSGAGTR